MTTTSAGLEQALAALDVMTADLDAPSAVRGDARDGRVYLTTPQTVTALKVALITGRPLLIRGPAGAGKSSLASYVARNLGAAYFEFVANDDSVASDLLWRFDAVRRLSDAQSERTEIVSGVAGIAPYIDPGPLWWALNPTSAANRGLDDDERERLGLPRLAAPDLLGDRRTQGAVLLIDEIDKADAAFCNGLLVPLGSRQFAVPPLPGPPIRWDDSAAPWSPLVIVTTNDERDLPRAFLRRCLALTMQPADADRLVEIALHQFGADLIEGPVLDLVRDLAQRLAAPTLGGDGHISVAEFLDLVTVALGLGDTDLDGQQWHTVRSLVTDKGQDARGSRRRWTG